MNSYEMTGKSFLSGSSSGCGNTSVLSNMKMVLAKEEQKIQNKIKELSDLKDSMNVPLKFTQIGLSSKESFNRTKMISTNFENSTGGQWNLGEYINQEQRSELEVEPRRSAIKEDLELIRLKQRYLNDG